MDDFIRYKHSAPGGDLIATLPGIRQIYRDKGKKAVIYQRLDMVGQDHAYQNEQGEHVCMNRGAFNMMRPLLLRQEYIQDYIVYEGQDIDVDLDKIRLEVFTNQPLGSINRWPFYVYPDMACDLSESWIAKHSVFNHYKDFVILNFTPRYRNHLINYFFLKKHEKQLAFVGLPHEYESFCDTWGLNITNLLVGHFDDLAAVINDCKFFMGNASMCFQIAEGLKVPRILETFKLMPNVIPIGKNAYDGYHQGAIEYYFSKLINL